MSFQIPLGKRNYSQFGLSLEQDKHPTPSETKKKVKVLLKLSLCLFLDIRQTGEFYRRRTTHHQEVSENGNRIGDSK